jgi:hypothetical protein
MSEELQVRRPGSWKTKAEQHTHPVAAWASWRIEEHGSQRIVHRKRVVVHGPITGFAVGQDWHCGVRWYARQRRRGCLNRPGIAGGSNS